MVGRVGFPSGAASLLIFAASSVRSSTGMSSLKREKDIRSSVRYHVCLFRDVEVLVETALLIFLNFSRDL